MHSSPKAKRKEKNQDVSDSKTYRRPQIPSTPQYPGAFKSEWLLSTLFDLRLPGLELNHAIREKKKAISIYDAHAGAGNQIKAGLESYRLVRSL